MKIGRMGAGLVFYKIIAAILIFLISMGSALYLLKRNRGLQHHESIQLGEALASGIFLGAAFFHMLPDAIQLFQQIDSTQTYPFAELICVAGFLLLLALERLSLANVSFHSHSIPYILVITLIIHALTEGAALGIGGTFSETIMIFIAILAHKGSESFALCMTLLKHHFPFQRILYIIIFFSCMTPLGIGLGTAINLSTFTNGELAAAIFNAFAAGTFLYISTLHHVHFHQHKAETQGMIEFACLVAGASIMGLIALWA